MTATVANMDAKGRRPSPKGEASSSGVNKVRADRPNRTHRGLTCANCRVRKTRCDGTQPRCKTCEVYHDECRYEKPPPMTQIVAMAKRLQDAERTIRELTRALDERSLMQVRQSALPDPFGEPVPPPSSAGPRPAPRHPAPEQRRSVSQAQSRGSSREAFSEELLSDLSLDEHGKICYYGPTSAVHDPPSLPAPRSPSQGVNDQSSVEDIRDWLTSNAKESRSWEEFSLGNAAAQTDIPRDVLDRLLQIHWSWIAPMFMWIYRPAFMRDMSTGGPYYSPFLVTVLCAHAARFEDGNLSEILISRARLLLGSEIHKPSSIPTVQAMLQLSAREFAHGNTSQGWLYSGMAFRMVSDLGLHHVSGKAQSLSNLTPEDIEIRRRLFWSCYFWDKVVSLYLGRTPVLTEVPHSHSPELLDSLTEDELWSPYHGDSINLSLLPIGQYPPMKTHSISHFEGSCKLAVIINDIILQLYTKSVTPDAEESLRGIKESLNTWREQSPAHLRYDVDNLPAFCPPPHILTQNLLYHTTIILLHRPFYSSPAHHAACRTASDSIETLLLLLEKTFGFTRITYLMGYCIYTGASALVHDVRSGDYSAWMKMQTFLRALRLGVKSCPLLARSLAIITHSLPSNFEQQHHDDDGSVSQGVSAFGPDSSAPAGGLGVPQQHIKREPISSAEEGPGLPRNYLPAFPYAGVGVTDLPVDYASVSEGSGLSMEGFALLDSFPENHLDNVTAGWYMPHS